LPRLRRSEGKASPALSTEVIAPRLNVTYRGTAYPLYQRGEAWVIEVERATYFLTAGNDPTVQARRWLGKLPRNSIWPHTPAVLASEGSPLVLEVDGTIVRAWPTQLPRDNPPKTYEHPYRAPHRVIAVHEQPVWMFAARGRESSPGGNASSDQTVADVQQLAEAWLRG
jgi:hypothetical protein